MVCLKNTHGVLGFVIVTTIDHCNVDTIGHCVLNRLVQFNVIRRYVKTNSFPYYS